ncbi:MAG: glycosyltransferase family 2 protein [Selenomonadaceae bacterium]|nr:glycosyltransferase family 2 protein [Selenomonadaceae bacterium]
MKEIPAISVIIPLYNVEQYVGECLYSLLAQTFQNFEVIVVDDCSTDSSVEVVESYVPKFDGRLKLYSMEKKSNGGGSLPRNKGLEFSHGKYIYFMDGDDAIITTAFDELYKIAEEFAADVVHCEKFYKVPDEIWHDEQKRSQLKPDNHFLEGRLNVTKPTLLSCDINNRVSMFAAKKLIWNFWAQLIRRNFIIENDISLPDAAAQDMVFTMCELCCAQRYVIVPNVINFYRVRENSVSTEKISDTVRLHKWINTVKLSIRQLDNFLNKIDKFSNRTDLKYALFDMLARQMLEGLDPIYLKIRGFEIDEFLRNEFKEGDNVALTAFIFNSWNMQRLILRKHKDEFTRFNSFAVAAQNRIAELENEIKRLKNKE